MPPTSHGAANRKQVSGLYLRPGPARRKRPDRKPRERWKVVLHPVKKIEAQAEIGIGAWRRRRRPGGSETAETLRGSILTEDTGELYRR